jgi:hypothetical protein
MTITEQVPLAQRPGNREGANGQHRAQGKRPQPYNVTPEQVGDTPEGGGQGQFGSILHGAWGQHPGGPYPMGYHHEGQLPPGGHMATHDWRTGWDDHCHPKIKDMMHNYLVCTTGCVHLAEILDTAGKRQNDLPMLPKYIHPSGQMLLCWLSILRKCTFRNCHFRKEGGHPLPVDITVDFAN